MAKTLQNLRICFPTKQHAYLGILTLQMLMGRMPLMAEYGVPAAFHFIFFIISTIQPLFFNIVIRVGNPSETIELQSSTMQIRPPNT